MAKYVIELDDEPCMRENGYNFYTCKTVPWWSISDMIINRLTPYTEPDRKAIEDAQEEAWNLARKIMLCIADDGLTLYELRDCFGGDKYFTDVLRDYSYQETKARYDAWKKKKDEIRVGDEVEAEPGNKACVLYENPDGTHVFVFMADGTAAWWLKCIIHKTGKNHPEVAELLKKMKGEP